MPELGLITQQVEALPEAGTEPVQPHDFGQGLPFKNYL